jgi:hypothetical protein
MDIMFERDFKDINAHIFENEFKELFEKGTC